VTAFDEHVRAALDELPPESEEYMPDKITIFRRPLTEAFPDPEQLREEIRITVLHELAHYFGIDEERLDELGYS
jgi:predicted Zn-dependent protease with MMP-like domain